MIRAAIYAVPVIAAVLSLCLAAAHHSAAVRKAIRAKNTDESTLRSEAIGVSMYSIMTFVSLAIRLQFPDVKEHGTAICLIAAGLPFSVAWGWGVYRSVKRIRDLSKPDEGKA